MCVTFDKIVPPNAFRPHGNTRESLFCERLCARRRSIKVTSSKSPRSVRVPRNFRKNWFPKTRSSCATIRDVSLSTSVAGYPGHPVYGSTRLQFGGLPGRRLDDVLNSYGGKAGFPRRARPRIVTSGLSVRNDFQPRLIFDFRFM